MTVRRPTFLLACLALLVSSLPPGPAHAQGSLTVGRTPGEFSVGPTGQASYRIPLQVPPGTAGLAPELALVYVSGGGNGVAGQGWSLSGLPTITRCPATTVVDGFVGGVQGTQDDRFCLDGERLVQVNGDYFVGSEHRTLRETWSRIISRHGPGSLGPEWFEAETRNGMRFEFGRVPAARVMTEVRTEPGTSISGVVNFAFGVSRITDRHGNVMDVTWDPHDNTLYPRRITYGGRRVEFVYEYRASDSPARWVAALRMRQARRLVRVDVYLDPAGPGSPASAQLVRRYNLTYEVSPTSQRSLLRTVQACEGGGTCLPATTLSYDTPSFNGSFDHYVPQGEIFQDHLRYQPGAVLTPGDFNGDGVTDFIRQERGDRAEDGENMANTYIGDGRGGFERKWLVDNVLLSGNHRRLHVGDYNGDGIDDFLVQDDSETLPLQLYRATGTGGFQRTSLYALDVRMSSKEVRLIPGDFDGDGRTDFLRQEIGDWGAVDGYASIYFSEGTTFRREFFDGVSVLNGNAVDVQPADFNGDGLTDLLVRERGSQWASSIRAPVEVWLSKGDGEFTRLAFYDSPRLRSDACNIIIGDYNGDGMSDFVRQERGSWDNDFLTTFQVYTSKGNGRFEIVTPGSPERYDVYQDYGRYDDSATFTPGDFNGDGLTDLLRREFGAREKDDTLTFQIYLSRGDSTFIVHTPPGELYQRYLRTDAGTNVIVGDFDGDGQTDFLRQETGDWDNDTVGTFYVFKNRHARPDFLVQIDEGGTGLRTEVTYTPTTRGGIYTPGQRGTFPGSPVSTPVYVVADYVQRDLYRDGASRQFSYTYGDARDTRNGRGFLGFRRVSRVEHHTGLRTDSFYQEAWPFNALVTRTEIRRDADDALVGAMDMDYVVSRPAGANYALAIARVDTTHVEGSGTYQTRKEYTHDAYGNATLVVDQGVVGDPGDDTTSCTVFANDVASWQLGLALETTDARSCTATCACTDVLHRERHVYDQRGRVVAAESYESEADRWIGESLAYDEYGNVIERTNAAGAITAYVFDSAYHTYPVDEILDAEGEGIISRFEFSPAFGVLLRETKPDGSVFRREVDGFGRTTRMYGPGPSGETLLAEIRLVGSASAYYEEVKGRADFGVASFIITRTYRDAFERPYRVEKSDGSTDAPIVVTTTYDAAGRVLRESQPHHAGAAAPFTEYAYDDKGRITSATLPNGATQEAAYAIATGACAGCIVRRTVTENRGAPEQRRIVHDIDGRGKVRRREHEGGMVLRYELDLAGRVTRYEDASVATSITYDSLGRTKTVTSPDTGVTRYEYDAAGRVREIRNALDHTVTLEYDAMNRPIAQRFSDDRAIFFEYDAQSVDADLVSSAYVEQDGEERSRFRYAYDSYGNLTSKAITYEGQTYTFSMTYGPGGRPTSLTYPDGSTLVHSYDGMNRLRELRIGSVAYATYGDYTALGAPGSVHYANGVDTTYQYASHGVVERNVIESSAAGTLLDQEFEHDLRMYVTRIVDNVQGHDQEFVYDARGFLQEVRSPEVFGTRTYGYDAAGNLTSRDGVAQQYAGHRVVSDSSGATYGYDAGGNRIAMHRDGADWTYGYDHARQLTEVFEGDRRVGTYEYDPEGMRIRKTDASGVITTYLTPQYEITFLPASDGAPARTLHTRYIFDHTGRVAAVTLDGAVAGGLVAEREAALASNATGASGSSTLASAPPFGSSGPTPAGMAAMLGLVAFAFFARERMRPGARTAFMQRSPHRAALVPVLVSTLLLGLTPGCQGGAGGGGATVTTVNGMDYVELDKVLAPGGNGYGHPIEGTYFFHQDRVGSTSLVTDAEGALVSRLVYLPYGEVHEQASDGYDVFRAKFGDKERDRDAGLYYFDSRYYDPVAGRFLTADSYLVGGDAELPGVLNRYQYAGNNPIAHADPSGNFVLLIFLAGFVLGAYFAGVAANGGTWNLAHWDWRSADTWVALVAGGLAGGFGAVAGSWSAVIGIAIADSAVQSAIAGASTEQMLANLGWDLLFAIGGKAVGDKVGNALDRLMKRRPDGAAEAVRPRTDRGPDAPEAAGRAGDDGAGPEPPTLGAAGRSASAQTNADAMTPEIEAVAAPSQWWPRLPRDRYEVVDFLRYASRAVGASVNARAFGSTLLGPLGEEALKAEVQE